MEPKKILFDTDLGGDCDDVIALDVLLSAHKAGKCELIGVTYSYFCRTACGCIYEILRQYGMEALPLGRMPIPEGRKEYKGTYAAQVVEQFGREDTPTYDTVPDAVPVLRALLAANEDVTLVVVGSMTNIDALLQSAPDEISPLDGQTLVRQRVRQICVMGGSFRHQDTRNPEPGGVAEDGTVLPMCEWNIRCDVPAARRLFETCPSPITVIPFELGYNYFSGQPVYEAGKGDTPDSYCMQVYGCTDHGHHSWDPITAYYAVFGAPPVFRLTSPGKVTVDENGFTHFDTLHGGIHRLLYAAVPREEVSAAINRVLADLNA